MALLKQFKTSYGTIRITRSKSDGSVAYYQNGCFHSQTNKRGTSLCAYIHAIHEIIRQAKAKRVLMIGCAGGSLATMLHRLGCTVTAVDINPMAFTVARDYFHMPDEVETICCDGIIFVRDTLQQFDAVIVDVFSSDNKVPRAFTARDFFDDVHNILSPNGIMIMNVIVRDDADHRALRLARRVQTVVNRVMLVDWQGETNRNSLIVTGMPHKPNLPSGLEPTWMREDMEGVSCRLLRRDSSESVHKNMKRAL